MKKASTICEVTSKFRFTSREKSHFHAAKMRKWGKFAHTNLGTPETWILRLDKNAFSGLKNELNFYILCEVHLTDGSQICKNSVFREPKCVKFAHTKPGTCGKFPHTNLGTLHT